MIAATGRFADADSKAQDQARDLITSEVPFHLQVSIHWVDAQRFADLEVNMEKWRVRRAHLFAETYPYPEDGAS